MKFRDDHGNGRFRRSRPTRGAWIEIAWQVRNDLVVSVAPHKGRVD